MKLNIAHLGRTDFFDRKGDIIYGLFHAFSTLGYDTTITHNTLSGSSLNLIIGSDILSGHKDAVQNLIQKKYDYVVYEVENFNGSTINYREKFDLENYLTLIKNARFVITPYLYNVKKLRAVCGEDKTVYAKWGYDQSMTSANIARNDNFEYDALHIGLIKGDRVQKFQSITNKKNRRVRFIDAEDPFTIRDWGVSMSRYGLALSYGATDDFVNPFRLYYMAANGMPILADHTVDEDDYLGLCECMPFNKMMQKLGRPAPPPTQIIDRCRSTPLLSENLRGLI